MEDAENACASAPPVIKLSHFAARVRLIKTTIKAVNMAGNMKQDRSKRSYQYTGQDNAARTMRLRPAPDSPSPGALSFTTLRTIDIKRHPIGCLFFRPDFLSQAPTFNQSGVHMSIPGNQENLSFNLSGRQQVLALRVAAGIGAMLALAALAPFVWGAVSGGLGLLALALTGGAGVALFQALPLLGQKLENRLLAARKAEARANPIEQLQNFLLQKRQRVVAFKQSVVRIGAQIKSMSDMIEERKRQKPGYDASRQESAVKAMKEAHLLLVVKYKNAELALVQLGEVVEDKKFEWRFGQAGQAALHNLNATSGQELLNQMLADEAFDSVRDNFNQVFSELEMEAEKISKAQGLSFDDGMAIELGPIAIDQLDKARS